MENRPCMLFFRERATIRALASDRGDQLLHCAVDSVGEGTLGDDVRNCGDRSGGQTSSHERCTYYSRAGKVLHQPPVRLMLLLDLLEGSTNRCVSLISGDGSLLLRRQAEQQRPSLIKGS